MTLGDISQVDEHVTVLARVASITSRRMQNRPGTIQELVITDGRGELRCTFFKQPYLLKQLPVVMRAQTNEFLPGEGV